MRHFVPVDGRPTFSRALIIRLGRLLDMEYKPAEIADELGISADTIRRNYLRNGCPHRRESSGAIWIHGKSFAAWAMEINELNKRKSFVLSDSQTWCVRCNHVVEMVDMHERRIKKNLIMIYGKCSVCGGKVNRLKSGKEDEK